VQDSNTDKFIFPLGEIFEFVTRFTTLEPGDILTTGTPEGEGAMVDGDVVEITIDGIGTLSNTVRDEK
jgi:2-keto-4-pentenoate hydratase/2-oxohepta-3-ene-1,7-dioic acid hydratase in catechol pathway